MDRYVDDFEIERSPRKPVWFIISICLMVAFLLAVFVTNQFAEPNQPHISMEPGPVIIRFDTVCRDDGKFWYGISLAKKDAPIICMEPEEGFNWFPDSSECSAHPDAALCVGRV